MRWPLRNQILIPFASIVLLAVTLLTGIAALIAVRNRQNQALGQLQGIVETLDQSALPYTDQILEKMRGLTSAHFVVETIHGELVATTLPHDTADLTLERWNERLARTADRGVLEINATRYYAVKLRTGNRQGQRLIVLYPAQNLRQTQWEAALPPLLVGIGAVLLTMLVAVGLSQRFSRRLNLLQSQVAAIADGEFREIGLPRESDEFQDLVRDVNRMSRRLKGMQNTILQTERARLLAQLAGGLAHQLRNAVTGAKLSLQLHHRRCPLENDSSLSVALRQLALTEVQLRGLLSLGKNEPRPQTPCDLKLLIREVAELLEPICQHAGVTLQETGLPLDPPLTLTGDQESLRAAVLNLTQNGIEAAGPGGVVELRVGRTADTLEIEVSDNGPGPSADVANTLFDPFVTSKSEGVGLGLSLAWQVALDHHGVLTWHRESDRTCFCLKFSVP